MTVSKRGKFCQILVIGLIFALICVNIFVYLPNYNQVSALREREAELVRRIEENNRLISEYADKQHRITFDKEFVESLARKDRRVYPGELVFVFDDK